MQPNPNSARFVAAGRMLISSFQAVVFLAGILSTMVPLQAQGGGNKTVTHIVTMDNAVRGLNRSGYRFCNVSVQRLTRDLGQPEEITVSVLGYPQRSVMSIKQAVIPAGQAKLDIPVVYYTHPSQNYSLVVSNDGSSSQMPRRGRLAEWSLGWGGGDYDEEYTFLYAYQDGMMPAPYNVESISHLAGGGTVYGGGPSKVPQTNLGIPTLGKLSNLLGQSDFRPNVSGGISSTDKNAEYMALRLFRHLAGSTLGQLPESATGLHCFDFVVISVQDLQRLASQHPGKSEALRKWTAMGGRLVIFDCQQDYRGLPSILPNLAAHQDSSPNPDRRQAWTGWKEVDSDAVIKQIQSQKNSTNQGNAAYYGQEYEMGTPMWLEGLRSGKSITVSGRGAELSDAAAQQDVPVLFHDYGLGRILAAREDLSSYSQGDWATLLRSASDRECWTPYENFGKHHAVMGPVRQFQVPNVGDPPKVTFLVLITLFALLVGPLMFIWLNRVNRLNLLMFFIPLMSLLSVFALFGYVVLADGFDFRSSRLSFTELDSQNGVAITQTSQALYTGGSPESYEVDDDTLFATDQDEHSAKLTLKHAGESQEFSGARINVRTKHHVTTMQVDDAPAGLQLSSANGTPFKDATGEQALQVRNGLGVPIELLIVKTEQGLAMARNIPVDGQELLERNSAELPTTLSRLYAQLHKNTEQGKNRQSYRNYYYYGNTWIEPIGLLEQRFRVPGERKLGRLSYELTRQSAIGNFEDMEPGEFYCVSRESRLAQQLKTDVNYVFQYHVIHGQCEVK